MLSLEMIVLINTKLLENNKIKYKFNLIKS